MDTLWQLVVLAILCEAIVETLKMTWQEGKLKIDRVVALIIGVTIAATTNFNIISALGINSRFFIVGILCTGIILSRGSNFVHDLIKLLINKVSKKDSKETVLIEK